MKKTKRILSLLLAVIMIVGVLPNNVLAAVEKPDWDTVVENNQGDNWTLAEGQRLVKVLKAEPQTIAKLSYEGTFVDGEGYTNLRFILKQRHRSATLVWDKYLFRFPAELYDQVDFTRSEIISARDQKPIRFDNSIRHNEKSIQRSAIFRPGIAFYTMSIPINIVLKDKKTLADLNAKDDMLLQMRITDANNERIFSYATEAGDLDYNMYTFTTLIPAKSKLDINTVNELNSLTDSKKSPVIQIDNSTQIIKYDPENGRLRVAYGYNKEGSLSDENGSLNTLGLRQIVPASFKTLLKPNLNQKVGRVFLGDKRTDPFFSGEELTNNTVDFALSEFNDVGNASYLLFAKNTYNARNDEQVVRTSKFNDILVHGKLEDAIPVYTIVEYYLDRDKVKNLFKDKAIESDDFVENFIVRTDMVQNTDGRAARYTFKAKDDIVLKSGDFIRVNFDPAVSRNQIVNIRVGGKAGLNFSYNGYTNVTGSGDDAFELLNMSNAGIGKSNNYRVKLPKGMTIKTGETVEVIVVGENDKDFTNTAGSKLILGTKEYTFSEFLTRDIVEENMTITHTDDVASILFMKTDTLPKVDEIFTDSQKISGHTNYLNSSVNIKEFINAENYISTRTPEYGEQVTIDGKNYTGFKFDVPNEITSPQAGGSLRLEKDAPILVNNARGGAVPSDYVVEQVQAKVTFDLNGGNIAGEAEPIEKIAPLNKNLKYDKKTGQENPDYVPSGFAGDDIALNDHNGDPLKGKELTKRQYPTKETQSPLEAPKKGADFFLGWSTKPVKTEEDMKAYNEAETISKAEDWTQAKTGTMFKLDENSPIIEKTKVYAVYGNQMTIRLHRNSSPGDTEVYEVKVSASDFQAKKGKIKLPRAYDNKDMELPETFKVDKNTFVGWKYDKDDATIDLSKGVLDQANKHIKDIALDQAKQAGVRILDGTTIEFTGKFADYAQEGLDLYGIYAPYIDVKAEKKYEGEGLDATSGPTVNIGLLYRTAVTDYNNPTIHNQAAYFVPQDAKEIDQKAYESYSTQGIGLSSIPKEAILKYYSPKKGHTANDLQWSVRGYDENGDRLSYIIAEVGSTYGTINHAGSIAKLNTYYNFNQDWKTLGISVIPGAPVEKSGKTQIVELTDSGVNAVDTYSGATVRTVEHQTPNDIKTPVKSYSFVITNTKLQAGAPVIKEVYSGEKSFTLTQPTVKNEINFITVKITDAQTSQVKEYRFKHDDNKDYVWSLVDEAGQYVTNPEIDPTYNPKTREIEVAYTGDRAFAKGDKIEVQYDVGTAENPVESNWSNVIVQDRPEAGPVTGLVQRPNMDSKDPNGENFDTVVVEGQRPTSGIAVPSKDATYTVGTMENGVFTPLTNEAGDNITIPMDPNNATVRFEIPKSKLKDGQELVIQSKDPGKTDGLSDSIALDLQAPQVTDAQAVDGGHRMFIDITAKADSSLDIREGRAKIVFNGKEFPLQSGLNLREENTGYTIDLSSVIPRPSESSETSPTIKLIVTDNLNNKAEIDVEYTASALKPEFKVDNPRADHDYISLSLINGRKADKFNIRIRRGTDEIYNKDHGIISGNTELFIDLFDQNDEPLYLERRDIVTITAYDGNLTASMRLRVR